MKIARYRYAPLALLAGAVPWVMGQASQPQTSSAGSDVKTISLPPIPPPNLPDGPGHDVYMVQCGICHTQRYVTMQPRFTRKVWAAEVDKMINTYKAQVPPDQVKNIIDYLVSIRGVEAEQGK
jgi:cytochrome c5